MKNALTHASLFLLFILIFSAIYSPVIYYDYLYHDDINYFLQTPTSLIPPGQKHNFFVGRFLGATIFTASAFLVKSVEDLWIIRFLSIVQFSLMGFLLCMFFKRSWFNVYYSVLIPIIILTLPPFQVIVGYAGISFHSTAALLGLISALIANRIPIDRPWIKRIFSLRMILALFVNLCAISTYPSTATFFWVIPTCIVLFDRNLNLREQCIKMMNFFVAGLGGIASYALIIRLIKKFSMKQVFGFYNPYDTTKDYFAKILWFFEEPLYNSLNLWNIYPTDRYIYIVSLIIVFGLLLTLYQSFKKDGAKATWQRFGLHTILLVCFIILSFLPNFVTRANIPFYRCCAALTSIVVILLFWALSTAQQLLPKRVGAVSLLLILLGTTGWGSWKAYEHVYAYRAYPCYLEYNKLKNAIERVNITTFDRIHIVRPEEINLKSRWDEYVTPTSRYPQDILGFVSAGIMDTFKNKVEIYQVTYNFQTELATYIFRHNQDQSKKSGLKIKISSSLKDELKPFKEPTLVVDMTELYEPGEALHHLVKVK